jgi:translation initiation factor 4E
MFFFVSSYRLTQLLALIGEELDADDEICGVVMSPRRVHDKLAIWTRNASNSQAVLAIGHKLRQVLDLPPQEKIEYLVR